MERKRILVADDEIYVVHILEFTLTMEGYDVLSADDGEEALRRIEQDRPDLVVLDIMMPKMDGYEVLRRIRADAEEWIRQMPVIVLSSKGRPIDRETGLEMGADDYVVKPFSPSRLLEKIRDLLDRRRLASLTGQ
ncbi:MAG: response regulator [Patescibacteria group bacterium]|jgi:OmpR family response regulator RpaB